MDHSFHFGIRENKEKRQDQTNDIKSKKHKSNGTDRIFLITVILLTVIGTVMIASAGSAYAKAQYSNKWHFVSKQIVFAAVGFVMLFVTSRLKSGFYFRYAPHLYIITVILLILVLIIGVNLNGAKRWINLGFATFQPSELAKLSIVMIMSWYFTKNKDTVFKKKGMSRFISDTVIPFGFIGLLCGLVALEKHLSGIVIIGSIGILMMFISGSRVKNLSLVGGIGFSGIGAFALLTDYTKKRIDIWRNPELYPQDGGWQTIQGKLAIGSGGFFGLGLGNSRLKYSYVAEPANDFIFTVICEETGFVGAMIILFIFSVLIYRGFCIALRCKKMFDMLIVLGITSKVAIQVILNIAVVTNVFPNTGIALPFFSYGGTSLIILLAEMGIILSISRESKIRK
ncbi:MAG: putative peptidoglycan glycosyltransferase FtsW [Eubacteriales bacterium]|nr:putative peptidoglycan glycosyltransferase FtsW [Eubacteriales bacterium]